jgi:hypothetical protein
MMHLFGVRRLVAAFFFDRSMTGQENGQQDHLLVPHFLVKKESGDKSAFF